LRHIDTTATQQLGELLDRLDAVNDFLDS